MDDLIDTFSQTLIAQGYRLTAARQAIIETLVQCAGHVSASDLVVRVRQTAPHVGRMTVYRTLGLLTELGLIRPIYQGTGAAHYILMASGSHHHLICNRCHEVIEFEQCTAAELTQQLAQQFNFQVQSHLLEIHGLCVNCHQ